MPILHTFELSDWLKNWHMTQLLTWHVHTFLELLGVSVTENIWDYDRDKYSSAIVFSGSLDEKPLDLGPGWIVIPIV